MTPPGIVATRAPASWAWNPAFWVRTPRLLLGSTAGLIAFIVTLFVLPGGLHRLWVLAIQCLFLASLAVAARALARLQVETAIAVDVELRCSATLRQIEAGGAGRPALDRVEAEYLPVNPDPEIAILRLLRQIIKEGKDRKFSSTFLLMEPYREESFGPLVRLHGIQRGALQLGILGTFLGLIFALSRLLFLPNGGVEVGGFQSLVESLYLAFGTSVAGIEVSVFTSVLGSAVQAQQGRYFQAMEEATVALRSLTRNAVNNDEYLAEIGEVQTAVRQLSDRILHQAHETSNQTSVLREGMERLSATKRELDGFLESLEQEQRGFLEDMRTVYDVLSPQRVAEDLRQCLASSSEDLVATWRAEASDLFGAFEELGPTLTGIRETLGDVESSFEGEVEGFRAARESFSEALAALSKDLAEVTERQTQWLDQVSARIPEDLDSKLVAAVEIGATRTAEVLETQFARQAQEQAQAVEAFKTVGQILSANLRSILGELAGVRADLQALAGRSRQDGLTRRLLRWLANRLPYRGRKTHPLRRPHARPGT